MAAALFLSGGLGSFVSALLPGAAGLDRLAIMAVSLVGIGVGVVVWYLPWERWPRGVSLWLVPIAFALIAVGNHFTDAEPYRYGIYFVAAFTWIGLAHPRRTSLAFIPLLVVAYLVPLFTTDSLTAASLGSLVIVGPICVAVGESIAWVSARLHVAETELREIASDARFRSLVQNASDVILILSPDLIIRYETPSIERVLGYRAEDRVGRSALELVHPADLAHVRSALARVSSQTGAEERLEFRLRHVNGAWHVIRATMKNLLADLHVDGIVINYQDITDQKVLERRLKQQAFTDVVTGLPNRALFVDRLDHALARLARQRSAAAVLFIDLDDFKTINDSLGHACGDRLLVEVADRLRGCVRSSDTAARFGGDEFAVLLEDLGSTTATETATRILAALAEPFLLEGLQLSIQASIGIVMVDSPAKSSADLLRDADLAMYRAKERGKGRYELFQPQLERMADDRLRARARVERALERP